MGLFGERKREDASEVLESGMTAEENRYFKGFGGVWNRVIVKRRLVGLGLLLKSAFQKDYERREALAFIKQMVRRIDSIIAEGEKRGQLLECLFENTSAFKTRDSLGLLVTRYGEELGSWLDEIYEAFPDCRPSVGQLKEMICMKKKVSTAGVALMVALQQIELEKEELDERVMHRIQSFAAFMCSIIRFSLVVEPGRPRTDLRKFLVEYEILENFNNNVELSAEELSQTAFDSNYLTKARNKSNFCLRVRLAFRGVLWGTEPSGVAASAAAQGDRGVEQRECAAWNRDVRGDKPAGRVGGGGLVSLLLAYSSCLSGTNDFIHANYVFGGPLRNKFILAQAPQSQTIVDFWQMAWQERAQFIVMLCGVVDSEDLAPMGSATPPGCPHYWPKPGESTEYGPFLVHNEGMSMTMDPLFQVTSLTIALVDEPTQYRRLQHWQYDWTEFNDFYWPIRLLKRLRTSKTPSIIHCLDGCSRSGTLLLIETMLMQLLHGSSNFANPMLTSAVFLRLQRRHAIANNLQYLYAYRVVLQWCEPYILSIYYRLLLGFYFDNSGFCGKFDDIVLTQGKSKLLTFK